MQTEILGKRKLEAEQFLKLHPVSCFSSLPSFATDFIRLNDDQRYNTPQDFLSFFSIPFTTQKYVLIHSVLKGTLDVMATFSFHQDAMTKSVFYASEEQCNLPTFCMFLIKHHQEHLSLNEHSTRDSNGMRVENRKIKQSFYGRDLLLF